MKKRTRVILKIIVIGLFITVSSGCKFHVPTATITDAKVCTTLIDNLCDKDLPILPVSSHEVFVSCLLKYSIADTKVKFTWYYHGETKMEIDYVVLNTGDNIGKQNLSSSLSRPANGWPKGGYEVVIQVQTDNANPLNKQFLIQ